MINLQFAIWPDCSRDKDEDEDEDDDEDAKTINLTRLIFVLQLFAYRIRANRLSLCGPLRLCDLCVRLVDFKPA